MKGLKLIRVTSIWITVVSLIALALILLMLLLSIVRIDDQFGSAGIIFFIGMFPVILIMLAVSVLMPSIMLITGIMGIRLSKNPFNNTARTCRILGSISIALSVISLGGMILEDTEVYSVLYCIPLLLVILSAFYTRGAYLIENNPAQDNHKNRRGNRNTRNKAAD